MPWSIRQAHPEKVLLISDREEPEIPQTETSARGLDPISEDIANHSRPVTEASVLLEHIDRTVLECHLSHDGSHGMTVIEGAIDRQLVA